MIRDKIEAEWTNLGIFIPNPLIHYTFAADTRHEREVKSNDTGYSRSRLGLSLRRPQAN